MKEEEKQIMAEKVLDTSHLNIEQRTTILEKQVLIINAQQERIVSDIESEKGTRARLNLDTISGIKEIERRVRMLEKAIWTAVGVTVVIEFLFRSKIL